MKNGEEILPPLPQISGTEKKIYIHAFKRAHYSSSIFQLLDFFYTSKSKLFKTLNGLRCGGPNDY